MRPKGAREIAEACNKICVTTIKLCASSEKRMAMRIAMHKLMNDAASHWLRPSAQYMG